MEFSVVQGEHFTCTSVIENIILCRQHPLSRVSGVFTLNWAPIIPADESQIGACFRVIYMVLVTGLLIIDSYATRISSDLNSTPCRYQ